MQATRAPSPLHSLKVLVVGEKPKQVVISKDRLHGLPTQVTVLTKDPWAVVVDDTTAEATSHGFSLAYHWLPCGAAAAAAAAA